MESANKMARAVDFEGSNKTLNAPKGVENVEQLHTFTNGRCSVSCWELDADELAEIARTGRVYLSVISGETQPPVFVSSESGMRAFVIDYGGTWKRTK
jgi:hypothetical protein